MLSSVFTGIPLILLSIIIQSGFGNLKTECHVSYIFSLTRVIKSLLKLSSFMWRFFEAFLLVPQ